MSEPATATPETIVPIKVPEPADHAPPTLAEPASGPVAEMSGAIPHEASKTENTSVENSTNVNGEPQSTETSSDKPITAVQEPHPVAAATPADVKDVEMKDSEEPAGEPILSTGITEGTSNGTSAPAPAPASASKPKRKSSTGVPEHKSKTLKKKQSKAKITHLDAQPGDYFLARLRSYPPWPSIICDEEMLPEVLLTTRPVTAKQSDGTYKEPYVDGGKKVGDRTFPVMFLHTNEFGWIPNTDLSELDVKTCKDVSEKGKAKQLIKAYEVASEEHDLQYFKDMLLQHEAALQADEDEKAAKAAEKAAKSEKKKRKSEIKADEDVEMDDVEPTPAKSSKKRKKEPESDEDEPEKQAAKTPKTTKLKLTTGKTPTTTEKKPKEKATKPKSEKKKKAAPESEEEVEPEKEEAPPLDPVEARKARDKEVLFLRHKLQKGFLSRDTEPQEDEMPQMATYFKKLEAYDDKLEVSIIRNTKINKVLKGIIKLNSIPKDEEYNFRERSVKLLGVWNQLLGAEPADSDKPGKEEKKDSPTTTNGVHKEAEEKAEEKIEPEVTEPKDNTISTEEAVEKVSAEVATDAGEKASAIDAVEKDEKTTADKEVAPAPAPAPAPVSDPVPAAVPMTEDKAPESAAAAAEAADVVKAAE